jgi:hypothetical protein
MMFVSFNSNTTGVTSGARTPNPSGALAPSFSGILVAYSFSHLWCFIDYFVVFLSFFVWSLCCLPFDFRAPLVPPVVLLLSKVSLQVMKEETKTGM